MNLDSAEINGWLNVFKEQGYTSSHIVRTLKKRFNIKKIGHYGTLDPMASGVLPLALGEATKTIQFITFTQKSYSFFINWGKETDTCDKAGKVLRETNIRPNIAEIKPTIQKYFMGNIDQTPPIFSAVKVNGKRAYQLARKNEKFEINSKRIKIINFELLQFINNNKAQFIVSCGPGTYVRSLARDLSKKLGTLGHASDIIRLKNSYFCISKSISYNKIIKSNKSNFYNKLLPVDYVLKNFEEIKLEKKYSDMLKDGKIVFLSKHNNNEERDSIFLIKCNSELVSIANLKKGYIIPRRNFNN
jgi:tRNA pseudouridine55 synthase